MSSPSQSLTARTEATLPGRPEKGWTALIDDVVAGRWMNPETGKLATVPYESIVIEDQLNGREADLVTALGLGDSFTVVADAATYDAMGARVAKALEKHGSVRRIILDHPHADMAAVADLTEKLAGAEGVVAVGSGTVNDLTKYVTGLDGRRYAVFATAASMNGYTSTTASITLESGLKVSLPSHAPSGFFVDLQVQADAPRHLSASGFADCLVRSVAQVDWWMSHRLLGSAYSDVPFMLQEEDERALNAHAAGLPNGSIAANGYLHRVLTMCGLGVSFTGTSNHGSMGEHQISHYIDCFSGDQHPGTLHGQQVGVAVLTMGRLQASLLASTTPPVLRPTQLDIDDMTRRMGAAVTQQCAAQIAPKVFDQAGTDRLNTRLAEIWPALRKELAAFVLPVAEMSRLLEAAGAPRTATDLGISVDLYREAVVHCREMRNRYSFLDLAADSGMLEDFASGEV